MATEVRRNDDAGRYEVLVDGAVAGYTEIKPRDGVLIMPHTQIDDAYGGQGLGKILVTGALDDIRSRRERIKPLCPYVRGFLEKNPQYSDLVA
jgi:predicted GNAT family acetyltransferase